MYLNLRRFCSCGCNSAYLSCRDNLLPAEILVNLFCPKCRPQQLRDATMLQDCGWILEYDVERAQVFFALRGLKSPATPAFIFDEGYLSWQGLAPGDQEINTRLHQRLAQGPGYLKLCLSLCKPMIPRRSQMHKVCY